MRVLVTGCAGFIGSNLTGQLLKNHKVIGIDNFNDYYSPKVKEFNIQEFLSNKNFKLVPEDILNTDKLEILFSSEKIDAVVHLAAWAGVTRSIKEPVYYVRNNIEGTVNLAELSARHNVKNFIFASTSSVYGNNKTPFKENMSTDHPLAPYPASKKSCELMLYTYTKNYGLPVTILRIFNPLGPKQRPDLALTQLIRSCLYGNEFTQYQDDDNSGRDYTYIGHLMDGIELLLNKPFDYEILNMGNSHPVKLGEFIKTCETVIGKKANIVKGEIRQGEMSLTYADISKAKKLIAYNPTTPIEKSIKIYYDWFVKQPEWYRKGEY